MKNSRFAWIGILVLLLAACGPAAEATSTRALPTSTATPAEATPQSKPTATPQSRPTATPESKPTAPLNKPVSGKLVSGGTLKFPFKSDPGGWDIHLDRQAPAFRAPMHLVLEPLFTPDPPELAACKQGLYPWLGESWSWDGLDLVVKLRKGVHYQNKPPVNGREVTSEDVVYALNRQLYEMRTGDTLALAKVITKVVAEDRYTVRIVNSQPHPALAVFLKGRSGFGVPVPPEWGDPKVLWRGAERWVGTGPFTFASERPGVSYTFEKNPNYWQGGLPHVDRVSIQIIPDASTRLASLVAGRIDLWNWDLPQPLYAALQKNGGISVGTCPRVGGDSLIWLQWQRPPFNDVRVRRAFSMAVDRDVLLRTIYEGGGRGGLFGPAGVTKWLLGPEDYPPELRKYLEYRPQEAQRLLAEAGFPKGVQVHLTTDATYQNSPKVLEAIVAMATPAGFKVAIEMVEPGRNRETYMAGKWPEVANGHMGSLDMDSPWWLAGLFHTRSDPTQNRGSVNDPEWDRLADAFQRETNETKQLELFRQLQFRGVDQVAAVFTATPPVNAAWQPWVKGYAFTGDPRYSTAWAANLWLER